jgi:hypothetical protein
MVLDCWIAEWLVVKSVFLASLCLLRVPEGSLGGCAVEGMKSEEWDGKGEEKQERTACGCQEAE